MYVSRLVELADTDDLFSEELNLRGVTSEGVMQYLLFRIHQPDRYLKEQKP